MHKDSTRRVTNATSKEEVYDSIIKNKWLEEILRKYFPSVEERNEFRQELWLIILQIKEERLIAMYNNPVRDELKGFVCGIISNQVKSSTSAWHNKHRKPMLDKVEWTYESNDKNDDSLNDIENKENYELKLKYIDKKLIEIEKKDPRLFRDIAVFKMHFNDNLSYQKISNKTRIARTSVGKYVNNIKYLLQKDKPNFY